MERKILAAITSLSARAGYGPIGQVSPEAVLAETRMDRATFVREVKRLADRGLVEIDDDTGSLQLARGAGGEDDADDAEMTTGIGTAPQPPAGPASPAPTMKMDPPRTPRPAPGTLPLLGRPAAGAPPTAASSPAKPRASRPAAKAKRPALPKRAAKAAVKQQRETAVAIEKRRAAKKAPTKAKRR